MTKDEKFASDGVTRVSIEAFSVNLLLYHALGSTVRVQRKNHHSVLFVSWDSWDGVNVQSVSVSNSYAGLIAVQGGAGVAHRSAHANNTDSSDDRIWNFGTALSMDATAGTGGPDPNTATPGTAPTLLLRSVTGVGAAIVNGVQIQVGPVTANV
jgi:hypothetical protein